MTSHPIPPVAFAIVCGSANWGLRFPEDLDEPGITVLQRDMTFSTPWGETREWKLVEIDAALTPDGAARNVLVVWSHGWPLETVEHDAQRRVFWVLREAGVQKVLCCSTMGALARGIFKGDFTIASDVLELTQTSYSLLPGRVSYDCSGKQLVCPQFSDVVEATAKEIWPAPSRVYGRRAHLVAGHAWGPRLTSPAEARAYKMLGADITNHSLAPEATLAREIGACFVNCGFITAAFDDYFASPEEKIIADGAIESLSFPASRVAIRSVARFDAGRTCLCAGLRSPQDERHRDIR